MAFKKLQSPTLAPDTPDELFRELPSRRIPDVLPHQQAIMRRYASAATSLPDVALQLPTGSGKTLVGLLIAEWRRRQNREKVVYLCPTRQLVHQVAEQAKEKYGLTVHGFTGRVRDYSPGPKADYLSATRVAVTTYSSLFNRKPFFKDPDVIILDDAHTAENYVAAAWSLTVERGNGEHKALHDSLCDILQPLLTPLNYARLRGRQNTLADSMWVDKVPTPDFSKVSSEIAEVLALHAADTPLQYTWSMIQEHLHACQLYLSSREILIRPLVPPTWSHTPFHEARQRIYMSATLGGGGDLERLMGRKHIHRLPAPDGWDRQGVGRRFFIFPTMSLDPQQTTALSYSLMRRVERSLVMAPSDRRRDAIAKAIQDDLGLSTFAANDIETTKKPFISTSKAVAVVANRYDGIDFPGDECRLIFVEGLAKATNLQERFLIERMGANLLFNERIQTRILQAIGRCTRSLEDYSVVFVSDDDLAAYFADPRKRVHLHPELQAEIEFGVEQSKHVTSESLEENFDIFLENGENWESANRDIVEARSAITQKPFPAMDDLANAVSDEIGFQRELWSANYEGALDSARRTLGKLASSDLRGYRCLWHYLAGSAASLAASAGVERLRALARTEFSHARSAANGIPWLVSLARFQPAGDPSAERTARLWEQIERVEVVLAKLGTVHNRRFAERQREILDGLESNDHVDFERAHALLGEQLGFVSGNKETEGAPDPWWIAGEICFVFEDHASAQGGSVLSVDKARQVSSHPNWMRANVEASKGANVLAVLVTPVTKIRRAAVAHVGDVALWPLDEFRKWARDAISVVDSVRQTFVEPGNLVWRGTAAEAFEQAGLDASGLYAELRARRVSEELTIV